MTAFFVTFILVGVARADALDDETRRIAKGLQCPVCQSVSVADSPSELAGQMRGVIRRKLEQGETEPEIVAYFVERYGDGVLLAPPRRGFSLAAWAVPAAVLAGGAGVLTLVVRGWLRPRRPGPGPATNAADRPGGTAAAPLPHALQSYTDRARAELEALRRNT